MSRPAILAAITSLGHMIDEGRVILYHDPEKPGNALHQLTDAIEAAVSKEIAREQRRAIEFGDIVAQQVIAMRAAVAAGHLESHAAGLQWIVNTLAGPGHLPDLDEVRAAGGAQAFFDREIAEHEAFRAAHPAPAREAA